MRDTAHDLLKRTISEGILAFPATPFQANGVDPDLFADHIADLVAHRPSAVVAAGGAGEIFSLSQDEHETLVRVAVDRAGDTPVIAGVGQGVAIACQMARVAERAGASAILIFPPYLIVADQEGLAAYVEAICRSVSIGVIAYSRDNGILAPDTAVRLADRCPNLVAIKDGTGDFESLVALKLRAGDRLAVINGVPTAETIALQCFAMGIRSYTSAIFTFVPELATSFHRALCDGDRAFVDRVLDQFVIPLTAIRRRRRGYAVTIVKAGLELVGKPMGSVRPPLVDLSPADRDDLAGLIGGVGALVAGRVASVPDAAIRVAG